MLRNSNIAAVDEQDRGRHEIDPCNLSPDNPVSGAPAQPLINGRFASSRTESLKAAMRQWLDTPRPKRSSFSALARNVGVSVQYMRRIRKKVEADQREEKLLARRQEQPTAGVIDKLKALREEMLDSHYAVNVEQKRYRELLAMTAEMAIEKRDTKAALQVLQLMSEFAKPRPDEVNEVQQRPIPRVVAIAVEKLRIAGEAHKAGRVLDANELEREAEARYAAQLAQSIAEEVKK